MMTIIVYKVKFKTKEYVTEEHLQKIQNGDYQGENYVRMFQKYINIMEAIIKFKSPVILTGPVTNLFNVEKILLKGGVILDFTKSSPSKKQVIRCENITKIMPMYIEAYQRKMSEPNPDIPLEWFRTTPMFFWQSREWWNYYYNTKYNAKPPIKTLNIPKQQKEFFEQFCIFE